jgi:hypothetical protein
VLREIANCRTGKEAPLAAVLTLRADFMGHALDDRTLAEVLKDADVKLGPMNAAELGEAVARPAELLGASWRRAPGQDRRRRERRPRPPPLMEFALDQLWDRQEWRVAEDGTEAAG